VLKKEDFSHSFKACFVFFNFCSQICTRVPFTQVDQVEEIRGRKFGESIHKGLNLKGMGPRFSAFAKVRAIGQWCEIPQGTIWEVMVSGRRRRGLWIRKRSSLAAICPTLVLLLF